MNPIRLGIFGLGRGEAYIECALKCNAQVVALCDKRQEALDAAAKQLGREVALYHDFDDLLSHNLDAVFLANNFHEHATYAIRCLEKGIHVLSECTANATMAEGVALVRAAEKSNAVYMLAENYPYMKFNQEIKRVCDGGTLGKILFAEGEYNHPLSPEDHNSLRVCRPYETHWRNFLPRSYYVTHSLAPLMHAVGATPIQVSALPVYAPLGDEYANGNFVGDRSAIITTLNDDDSVFRITGCAAYGAHGNSYRVCGEKGQIENLRGMGGKVMLRYNSWDVPKGQKETCLYDPQWQDEDADLAVSAGHEGSDYFVMRNFLRCIETGVKPDFDVYFATTMASVAILAHRSILAGGKPFRIPDFRREEDRKLYENDTLTPFYGSDGSKPTLPCCSRPDYKPSDSQMERYYKIIDNEL